MMDKTSYNASLLAQCEAETPTSLVSPLLSRLLEKADASTVALNRTTRGAGKTSDASAVCALALWLFPSDTSLAFKMKSNSHTQYKFERESLSMSPNLVVVLTCLQDFFEGLDNRYSQLEACDALTRANQRAFKLCLRLRAANGALLANKDGNATVSHVPTSVDVPFASSMSRKEKKIIPKDDSAFQGASSYSVLNEGKEIFAFNQEVLCRKASFHEIGEGFPQLPQSAKYKTVVDDIPKYLAKQITRPGRSGVNVAMGSAVFQACWESPKVRDMFSSAVRGFKDDIDKQFDKGKLDSRWEEGIKSEIGKAQVLLGSPLFHNHNVFDALTAYPEGNKAFNIPKKVSDWYNKQMLSLKPAKYFKRSCSLPRLSNGGLLLRGDKMTPEEVVFLKSISAVVAQRSKTFAEALRVSGNLARIISPSGQVDPASYMLLTRHMHAGDNKHMPVMDPSRSGSLVQSAIGYTVGAQPRCRAVGVMSTIPSVFRKPYLSAVMHSMFDAGGIWSTDPADVARKLNQVRHMTWNASHEAFEDGVGKLICVDMSAMDQHTCSQMQDINHQLYMAAFPEFTDDMCTFQRGTKLLTASDPYSGAVVIGYDFSGNAIMSGDPGVTVYNNQNHGLALTAVMCYLLGFEKGTAWAAEQLFSCRTRSMMHGDDANAYIRKDIPNVEFLEAYKHTAGWVATQEPCISFLKKFPAMAYGVTSDSKIFGNVGSLLKNRFGEYTNNNKFVFTAGAIDTLNLFPDSQYGGDYTKKYRQILDEVGRQRFGISLSQMDALYHSPQLAAGLNDYAADSIANAKHVQAMLDRVYYTQGHQLPSAYGGLTSYAQLDTAKLEGMSKFTDMPFSQLEQVVYDIQQSFVDNGGDTTCLKQYM